MNKILRNSFVALLAMIGLNVSAQEVTLDFTLADAENSKVSLWGFPAGSTNKKVAEESFTYGGYTVKVAGSTGNGYYWHDKDHYLLLGKQGAYVTLPAFDFDVERIDVEGNSGASTGVKQNIYVSDEAVSTETVGAQITNQYEIAEGKQAAGTIYTIKVNSNHNDQIKTIKIWKKGTSGPVVHIENTPETAYTIEKAAELIEAGQSLSEKVYVKGFITNITEVSTQYGNATFKIATTNNQDAEIKLVAYRAKYLENTTFTAENQITEGDEVIVYGRLNLNGSQGQISDGYIYSLNGLTTNINTIKTDADVNAPVYNVAGQKVAKSYKGVVIMNGKKFVNK